VEEAADKAGAEIWCYCLIPNHVHLIVAPALDRYGEFADFLGAPADHASAWRAFGNPKQAGGRWAVPTGSRLSRPERAAPWRHESMGLSQEYSAFSKLAP
jgi:hypothetical protein